MAEVLPVPGNHGAVLSVIMLIAGGLFVVFGRISLGQYAAFSGLIWTLSNPMRTLGNIVNDLQRFSASANKIIEIYYGSPEDSGPKRRSGQAGAL